MNYATMSAFARAAAVLAAVIAAFGATLGFFEMTGSYIIAGLFGVGVASLLGIGWHLVIGAAEHARRTSNRWVLASIGLLLVAVAISTSGWSLVTALGGKQALVDYQITAIEGHTLALSEAKSRVDNQMALVDSVSQHAVAASLLGEEEGLSGQGPLFRSYQRTSDNLNGAAQSMRAMLDSAEGDYAYGVGALKAARESLGDDEAFTKALSEVATAVAVLNDIDVTNSILQIGIVGVNDQGVPELDGMTASLREAATGAKTDPVPVPNYRHITRSQAVTLSGASIIGAWVAAVAIDAAPFIFLLLILAMANEPLLREQPNRRATSNEEIRVREDNVVGIKGAAE